MMFFVFVLLSSVYEDESSEMSSIYVSLFWLDDC